MGNHFYRFIITFSPNSPRFGRSLPGAQDHLFLRMRSLVREEEAQGGAQGLEDDPLGMDVSLVYYWLLLVIIDYNHK